MTDDDNASAFGDVVRAFARLHPDDDAAGRIARLFGYDTSTVMPTPVAAGAAPVSTREPTLPEVGRRPVSSAGARAAARRPRASATADRAFPWRRYLRPTGRTALARQGTDEGLPAETPALTVQAPPEPLLRPVTTPTLIHAMVATDAHDGELEITAVVAAVARRQRLDALPRWPRRSLLRGVQLLTDVAPAMAPYLADTELVAAAVSRVVGRGNTDHLRFAGTPLDGAGEGSAWTWAEYRPPPPGTPVLAVAELGLARVPGRLVGELHRSWLELRELLAGRGSPLVVLTPFPRDRWPDELAARVDLVHWDRSCTVSSVRRSRRQSPAPDGVAP